MMIRVLYIDNSSGTVPDTLLGEMIETGKIAAFCRASGWVDIKRGPIRKNVGRYDGPERRKAFTP